jgi:hypothetical protein
MRERMGVGRGVVLKISGPTGFPFGPLHPGTNEYLLPVQGFHSPLVLEISDINS